MKNLFALLAFGVLLACQADTVSPVSDILDQETPVDGYLIQAQIHGNWIDIGVLDPAETEWTDHAEQMSADAQILKHVTGFRKLPMPQIRANEDELSVFCDCVLPPMNPDDCEVGGPGTTGCSVTDGATGDECEVSCTKDRIPCCGVKETGGGNVQERDTLTDPVWHIIQDHSNNMSMTSRGDGSG